MWWQVECECEMLCDDVSASPRTLSTELTEQTAVSSDSRAAWRPVSALSVTCTGGERWAPDTRHFTGTLPTVLPDGHARCGDTGAAAGCHISALRADWLSWVHFIIYPPPHRVQDTEYMSGNTLSIEQELFAQVQKAHVIEVQ